jgi:hypothetical protein
MKLTLILSSIFAACSLYAETPSQLETEIAALQKQVAALQTAVTTIQANKALALAPFVSVDLSTENGVVGPNIVFSGANVHVVNGTGSTATINGLGNLIIGYDEVFTTPLNPGDRGGSHNLVIGKYNKFTLSGFGNLVAGEVNTVGGGEGNFVAGFQNVISGSADSILGGSWNYAGSAYDVVCGGHENSVSGGTSVILGGNNNTVTTGYTLVP